MSEEDDLSSSDSDNEFLTTTNTSDGVVTTDREALVRKKLLENFYGKTAIVEAPASTLTATIPRQSLRVNHKNKDNDENHRTNSKNDADSVTLDSIKQAENLIRVGTTHELLETEEKLSLQVRTLDSTMQTLVYENYSRFIDATDAIRSIGINVAANESGLKQLTTAMSSVSEHSRLIDEAVGTLRDQVAEKIRVQRLLTRLDTLLNLPVTLQAQITAGKYRTASLSYIQAASVLAKHSEGFESLKSIETECHAILDNLKVDLQRKMLHWSGRAMGIETAYSDDDDDDAKAYNDASPDEGSDDMEGPKPPQSMSEVFETAGALFIFHENENPGGVANSAAKEQLYASATAAAMRLLDRILDSHLIQVQERKFAGLGMDNSVTQGMLAASFETQRKLDGNDLIPRNVLAAILEAANLYGNCFKSRSCVDVEPDSATLNYCLIEFVSDAFASFIAHVRSILFEESSQASASRDGNMSDDGIDAPQEEISNALSLLVQYVEELATGLVDPNVGINADYAAKFVDQSKELAESVVRRGVDRKFHVLRLAVVKDCLRPFAQRAVLERNKALQEGKLALPEIVQVARSTLSDCLQLLDDTIRSIFADSSTATEELLDLKDATQVNTHRLARWLANAFEILAGGDVSDVKYITEAPLEESNTGLDESGSDIARLEGLDVSTSVDILMDDDLDDFSNAELMDMMFAARNDLSDESGSVQSDFILAIVDLCRLSEISVPENVEQSFTSHLGVNKKKSRGIFPSESKVSSSSMSVTKEENLLRQCFKVAGSRVLMQFSMNAGMEAVLCITRDLPDLAMKSDEDEEHGGPTAPSDMSLTILSVAKKTAIECANVYGGSKSGGPVPTLDDYPLLSGLSPTALNSLNSRKTGLQLDVERMFKETVTIYPHPSENMERTRNSVLFLLFKMAFRAIFESARLLTFSSSGARQLHVDAALLQFMLPHYVSSEYTENGVNGCSALTTLLKDVQDVICDRCVDESRGRHEDHTLYTQEAIRSFMASAESSSLGQQFIITEV